LATHGFATARQATKIFGMRLKIRRSATSLMAFAWLFLPVLIFFLGWLRPSVSLPLSAIGLASMYFACKAVMKTNAREDFFEISIPVMAVAIIALGGWCFIAGQGGYYYQSEDHHWRNAIFHDLINFKWPVIYDQTNSALAYYIAHWLPAALVGKMLGWEAANAALFLWTLAGLVIMFLLACQRLRVDSMAKAAVLLIVLVFFSGLDIIGILYDIVEKGPQSVCIDHFMQVHIEWWAGFDHFQYSSNMTQLMWVYNQAVAPWLVVALVMNEKSMANVALIAFLLFPFAPFPFIGFVPIACVLIAQRFFCIFSENRLKSFALEIFSPQNVAAVVVMFPVYYAYYSCNGRVANHGFRLGEYVHDPQFWTKTYIPFVAFEFMAYALVMAKKRHMRDPLFIVINCLLLAIPLFQMGDGTDFAMRASIPPLFFFMFYVIEFFLRESREKTRPSFSFCALIVLLSLGAVTPCFEQCRALHAIHDAGRVSLRADKITTFSFGDASIAHFVAVDPKETFFYKHLAKSLPAR
jgi:hypothetical protein